MAMFGAFNTFGKLGSPAGGRSLTLAQQIAAMSPSLWLEPSVTNGYQDSAGTTALTQPGAGSADPPVGLALDLSGNGLNATQSTSTARPKLSARVNLLTYTEDFSNAAWQKMSVAISSNAIAAPDGITNADKLYPSSTGTNRFIYQIFDTSAGIYSWSVFAKAGEKSILYIDFTGEGLYRAYFDLSSGTVGDVTSGYSASIISVGDGWYRCSGKKDTASSYSFSGVYGVADQNGSTSVVANGTDGIYICGAQFELGTTATAYQAVTDANTYDYSVAPLYWKFDVTDDWLATGTFSAGTFGANSDVFVLALKYSDSDCIYFYPSSNTVLFLGVSIPGDSAICHKNVGTPTVWVDGVQLAGGTSVTRATLASAMSLGVWHVLEFHNVDLSAAPILAFGAYNPPWPEGSYRGPCIIVPAQSDANRAVIRRYLAQKAGVTL